MEDSTYSTRNFPSAEANICWLWPLEKLATLEIAGSDIKLYGSYSRRPKSIGDIDVARASLVWSKTLVRFSGANRSFNSANAADGWLNQSQPSNSPNCSGCSIHGG